MPELKPPLKFSYSKILILMIFPLLFAIINLGKNLVPHYTWLLILICFTVCGIFIWQIYRLGSTVSPQEVTVTYPLWSKKVSTEDITKFKISKYGRVSILDKTNRKIKLLAIQKDNLLEIINYLNFK